jgi:hypothetical protein
MKCKANKARSLADAVELGKECNLVFLFGERPRVCSIKAVRTYAPHLLDSRINDKSFDETLIADAEITIESFYGLRSQKNVESLVEICRVACSRPRTSIALGPEKVIAVTTDAGKYGMFVVRETTSTSIDIDAWHILL